MRKKPSIGASEHLSKGTRITVTIPPHDYGVVRRMAQDKKVSAAWIVRDAVEKYILTEKALVSRTANVPPAV